MTITDHRCDRCGAQLPLPPGWESADGSDASVRFTYHPGDPHLRDNSGLLCPSCADLLTGAWSPTARPGRCVQCDAQVTRFTSLHLRMSSRDGDAQLCREHAVALLNALRTVEPKLDPATFRFPREPA